MKVAFVITRSDVIGGASAHVRDLADAMARRGHAPCVLLGGAGEVTAQFDALGVPYRSLAHLKHPLSPAHDLRATHELMRHLEALSPDLVAVHSSKAGVIGRLAAQRLGLPVTYTAHGWSVLVGHGLRARAYRRIERWMAPRCARIITVSEADRRYALREGIGSAGQVVVVHNGVPDVGATGRADPGREPPRIVSVARLEEPKDHATVLRALAGVTDQPWDLDLVGSGPLEASLRGLADELAIAGRVHFLGSRRDVPERLAGAQIFVLASSVEGFPLSILEAMRAGLPVVASDVGGIREAVEDGATGALIAGGDVPAMRRALGALLADPARRRSWGAGGRRRYEQGFTFDHMYARTMGVFEAVLGERRG